MAIHFKTLVTRTLTAGVFVGVLITSVLHSKEAFQTLILFILIMGVFELIRLHKPTKPLILYLLSYPLLISFLCLSFFSTNDYGIPLFNYIAYIVFILSFIASLLFLLFAPKSFLFDQKRLPLFALLYIGVPLFLFNRLAFISTDPNNDSYHSYVILGFFYLVWINDTCAYLAGSLLGKHKLAPKISPAKTIEGTIGGALFACGISYVVYLLFPNIAFVHWMISSIIIAIFGTLGDLFESHLKRKADIKDSGSLLPGHGGILDRFDSLFFSAPLVYVYLSLVYP